MKRLTLFFFLCLIAGVSCRKDKLTESCGCRSAKTEDVHDIFGIVIKTDDGIEILTDEKGLLLPCAPLPGNISIGSTVTLSGTLSIPCKKIPSEFDITPISLSKIKLRGAPYDKTDLTLTIIRSEDYGYPAGFGYKIDDTGTGFKILQPLIPAISGIHPFSTADDATSAGLLVIYLLRKNGGSLPSLSTEVLSYVNITP